MRDFLVLGLALGFSATLFDVTVPAGLVFRHENSPTPRKHLIETMGGGVALLDYNNDGLLDILFVNSGRISADAGTGKTRDSFDRANPRYWNRLFRQTKSGSFVDVTSAAGLDFGRRWELRHGCCRGRLR